MPTNEVVYLPMTLLSATSHEQLTFIVYEANRSRKVHLREVSGKFSSITIELPFVTLGRGLKKLIQSSLISVTPETRIF